MQPNLLMRAWMMAHLYGAKLQALVCSGGSDGEAAFRESLEPQYTSLRHDAKGLHTYYITGTSGGVAISRISTFFSYRTDTVEGCVGMLRITITSNTRSWQEECLAYNNRLVGLTLDLKRLVEVETSFLSGCANLEQINFEPLHAIEVVPIGFLRGCASLREVDLSPLTVLREVGSGFLADWVWGLG